MKKYFKFDDEPITGNDYWKRVFAGSILIGFFGIGLWTLAATGYKRAGTFSWNKEFRVIAAIFIPIVGIANLLATDEFYAESAINLFDIIASIGVVFHLVLLFKNGNKS